MKFTNKEHLVVQFSEELNRKFNKYDANFYGHRFDAIFEILNDNSKEELIELIADLYDDLTLAITAHDEEPK